MFSVQCKSFMCNTFNNAHTKHEPTHSNLPIVVGKGKLLKILCDTHNTTCKYMCCNKHTCTYCIHRDHAKHNYIYIDNEIKSIKHTCTYCIHRDRAKHNYIHLDNEIKSIKHTCTYCIHRDHAKHNYIYIDNEIKSIKHTCTYCIHRDHAKHNYIHLDNEIKSIKQLLNIQMEKYKLSNQLITTTKEDIPIAQNLFDQSLKLRKQSCITNYIDLLNKEGEEFEGTV